MEVLGEMKSQTERKTRFPAGEGEKAKGRHLYSKGKRGGEADGRF